MAEIKIYGTLLNDTAEPIAYAAQLRDVAEGKTQAALNQEFKSGIAAAGGKLQIATATVLGGVKSATTGTTAGRDYAVEVKTDGTMKVNVPWASYGAATASVAGLMSAADKGKLDGVATGAEVNQNALATVKVNGKAAFAAAAKQDTLDLYAGSNVTLVWDATAKRVTVSAKDTTYSAATASAAGLMAAADKSKLDALPTKEEYDAGNQGLLKMFDGVDTELKTLKDGKLDKPAAAQTTVADNNYILIGPDGDSTETSCVDYRVIKKDMTAAGTAAANAVKTELTPLINDKINTATYNALLARVEALEGALTLQ